MSRPKLIRKMTNPPHFKGFRPVGLPEENIPVVINYEEYEAIRLSDFEFFGQMKASRVMEISRSTYARIYESARRKIAQAFVLGKAIVFEGGKVYFDSEWYSCSNCGCWFNHSEKELAVTNCTLCGSPAIEQGKNDQDQLVDAKVCVCPICGVEHPHTPGIPCKMTICPDCNWNMKRKDAPHGGRVKNDILT